MITGEIKNRIDSIWDTFWTGGITKDIVVNSAPFDERLIVFQPYMIPLGKYIDNIHSVINPQEYA